MYIDAIQLIPLILLIKRQRLELHWSCLEAVQVGEMWISQNLYENANNVQLNQHIMILYKWRVDLKLWIYSWILH